MNAKDLKTRHPELYRQVYRAGAETAYYRAQKNLRELVRIYEGDPGTAIKCFLANETPLDIAIKQQKQLSMVDKKRVISDKSADVMMEESCGKNVQL